MGERVGALVRSRCFKTGKEQYFGVNRKSNCIDLWMGWESATCCGVNLAFAGFRVDLLFFLPFLKLVPRRAVACGASRYESLACGASRYESASCEALSLSG